MAIDAEDIKKELLEFPKEKLIEMFIKLKKINNKISEDYNKLEEEYLDKVSTEEILDTVHCQPYFTDREYRLVLAALGRERKVCEQVDKNCEGLLKLMDSIERKIKWIQYHDGA